MLRRRRRRGREWEKKEAAWPRREENRKCVEMGVEEEKVARFEVEDEEGGGRKKRCGREDNLNIII